MIGIHPPPSNFFSRIGIFIMLHVFYPAPWITYLKILYWIPIAPEHFKNLLEWLLITSPASQWATFFSPPQPYVSSFSLSDLPQASFCHRLLGTFFISSSKPEPIKAPMGIQPTREIKEDLPSIPHNSVKYSVTPSLTFLAGWSPLLCNHIPFCTLFFVALTIVEISDKFY